MSSSGGARVYLVGAGPGDPGLLTRRGAEVLGRADLVVCDGLVDPRILRLAPAAARIVFVGRRGEGRTVGQEDVNRLLVETARAGEVVVRLKGGDPYVFGRGGEEGVELAAAGISFEVVPGVSSFASVPGAAGIPLTFGEANGVSVLSGHEDPAKPAAQVDWAAAARVPGTKVVLMGVERIRFVADALIAGGMAAGTPAAMVRWGTTPEQETLVGTLGTIAERVVGAGFRSPAVLVVGEVVGRREVLDWFEVRPLFGQRVVVTRAREQNSALTSRLEAAGAQVIELPTIRFDVPIDPEPARRALATLGEFDWIVFTSTNGVDAFFARLFAGGDDLRALGQARLAAVGEATAARLRRLHLRVDAVPARQVGKEIAAAIAARESLRDLRVLLARAEAGAPGVREAFESAGSMVDDVAFYRTVPIVDEEADVVERLRRDGADWLTFTSGSTVTTFAARLDLRELLERHPALRVACIGPETAKVLAAQGVAAPTQAEPHTVEGLVEALVRASARKR